jgi:glycosyltransferase (activator-dependent family)
MVPLAWALLAAGHEVRVAGGPALVPAITAAGLPAVSVGYESPAPEFLAAATQGADLENELTDWTEPFVDRQDWDTLLLRYQMSVPMAFGLYNDCLVDDLVAHARAWRPDLILWESLTFAGPIAAAACGAAHARVNWMHDIYGAMREVFLKLQSEDPGRRDEDPLREWFEGHLDRYGCAFDETMTTGQVTLDLIPPSQQFDTALVRIPVRPVGYQGTAVLPDWLKEPPRRPRICITSGTSFADTLGLEVMHLGAMVRAMEDLDVDVVAAVPEAQAARLEPRPRNLVHAGFVPLRFLVPTCSAILHHGGYGSWASALLAGVPQHITAIRHGDFTVKGDFLVRAGAGLLRHPDSLPAEQLCVDVNRLVGDPAYRAGASALAAEVHAMASPAEVVARLDSVVPLLR